MDANEQRLPPLPEPVGPYERAAWGPKPDYFTADQLREYALAALAQQVPADGEWVLVPRAFIAELDDQLIDLSNERMAKGRAYSDRERAYDADILQRLRALAATTQAPQPVVSGTIGQQAVDGACNCPGGSKPASLHAPNCPVRTTENK